MSTRRHRYYAILPDILNSPLGEYLSFAVIIGLRPLGDTEPYLFIFFYYYAKYKIVLIYAHCNTMIYEPPTVRP